MGVSQFKQPGQGAPRPAPEVSPMPPASRPAQPGTAQTGAPRWEIGIDRNKVAAFIGVALIAGFGLGYLATRYLAWSLAPTEKAKPGLKAPTDPGNAAEHQGAIAATADFHKVTRIIRPDNLEIEGVGGVRLIGVSTPGSADPGAGAAQNAMKLATDTLLGREVRIEFEPLLAAGPDKDESGNALAYVYTRDGVLFNEELIKEGDAFAKVDQPSKFLDRFRAAEREAMEKGRGLWSPADKSAKGSLVSSASDKAGRRGSPARGPEAMMPPIMGPGTLDARAPGSSTPEPTVFVSSADRMYHKEGCAYLGKKGRPMMLSDAKSAGYVACGRCFASTVLKAP